jgi:predicted dehydrogenase
MRFGVVGLGSMGKRRVRDLRALGHEVTGFDVRADRNEEASSLFGIRTLPDLESLIASGPDALIISTPPDQHVRGYESAFEARLAFFSEASIFTPRAEWFAEREEKFGVRSFPSATWQFHPLFGVLRDQLLELGLDKVNSVHYQYGGYLPLWHPWERYDEFYAGRSRHTSAAREMLVFEAEWLLWVFGPVRAVACVRDRCVEWRTDIDDTYMLLLDFESGVRGTMNIELHQVAPFREGRVSCREQSFVLDLGAHELKRYDLATDSWRFIKPPGLRSLGSFDFEGVYLAEMRGFVDALEGRAPFVKSWEEDRHLSNLLYAAEESWRRREWVTLAEAEGAYEGVDLLADSEREEVDAAR